MSYMTTATSTALPRVRSPRLRLVTAPAPDGSQASHAWRSRDGRGRVAGMQTGALVVLIAGADAGRRAAVRAELRERLAPETSFDEASVLWEVLNAAATSGMVVLAGDLQDVSAKSLMHMVSHRYPDLPVISLDVASAGADAIQLRA
jgi:chloramphenicol 3-O-phosphotransferase